MNFYAYDETSGMDANGYYLNYRLAGSNENIGDMNNVPEIETMYLNSESFKDGDSVNETPFFYARVSDEKGINMSGTGIGHDMILCIDNSTILTYTLNSSYNTIDNNTGEIRFLIPELTPGKHSLTFKVWNILNISTIDSLHFNVEKGLKPTIIDITASHIPARDFTNFRLLHDRPESVIDVEIFVYDLSGRSVWSHKETGSSAWSKQYDVTWDLTNNKGNRVEQGIYIFRAIVNTPEGKEATKAKKIMVLKQ
jgi:hypothetical protein